MNGMKEAFSRGFDAGNYAYVYVNDDLNQAYDLTEEAVDGTLTSAIEKAFRAGFVGGFFSSFEEDEIPEEHHEEWVEARELARSIDERSME